MTSLDAVAGAQSIELGTTWVPITPRAKEILQRIRGNKKSEEAMVPLENRVADDSALQREKSVNPSDTVQISSQKPLYAFFNVDSFSEYTGYLLKNSDYFAAIGTDLKRVTAGLNYKAYGNFSDGMKKVFPIVQDELRYSKTLMATWYNMAADYISRPQQERDNYDFVAEVRALHKRDVQSTVMKGLVLKHGSSIPIKEFTQLAAIKEILVKYIAENFPNNGVSKPAMTDYSPIVNSPALR